MTAPTLTLADFLLARIAEEQEEAPYVHHESCASLDESPCDCPWPERVLAECQSKRRLVRNAQAWMISGGTSQALDTLGLLALPYADHPHYREDWRP